MKKLVLMPASLSLFSSTAFAASRSPCDNQTQCSSREACIESNCLEDGNVNITVSWTSNTDLDLHLRTPDSTEISPDLPDKTTAQGGRIVFDQCYSETCKDDTRGSSHPHVEHITWAKGNAIVKGKYQVWVENYHGADSASFRIVVEKPNGEKEFFEGTVSATAFEASTEFEFEIEFEEACADDKDTDGRVV